MTDALAFGIGLFGTAITLIVCALIIATVVWMWNGDWWTGQYNSFVDALEFAFKVIFTIIGVCALVGIFMFGVGISWAPLLERIYSGSS